MIYVILQLILYIWHVAFFMPRKLYEDLLKQFPLHDPPDRIIATRPLNMNRELPSGGIESIEVFLLYEKFYERFLKGPPVEDGKLEELARDIFRDVPFNFSNTDDAYTISFNPEKLAGPSGDYYGQSIIVRKPLITPKIRIILGKDCEEFHKQQRDNYSNFVWEMSNLLSG